MSTFQTNTLYIHLARYRPTILDSSQEAPSTARFGSGCHNIAAQDRPNIKSMGHDALAVMIHCMPKLSPQV